MLHHIFTVVLVAAIAAIAVSIIKHEINNKKIS
jgi:hypothetical protein